MYRSLTLAACAAVALALPTADVMTDLPSAPSWPTTMYSGYLNVDAEKALHYVFATSMSATNPELDPVVIWLNGGPGCSSMLGLMQENGPIINDDGETTLKLNDYPWNTNLNMLYIESPAGVGWSTVTSEALLQQNDLQQS